MDSRLSQLISAFKARKIDALLVTKDVNIKYLTSFPASESWLLVCPDKAFYITDFRYVLEAREGLKAGLSGAKPGIVVTRYRKSAAETLFQIARQRGIRRIGLDERHISLSLYRLLRRKCPAPVRLVKADNLVENLREVKAPQEIDKIRKALAVHKRAYQFLKKAVKPGFSEREVFSRLEEFVKSQKAGFSFDPIIASGANSCYPHARVTDRRIRCNELVLIDMGIDVKGYKSDLTRIFFLGRIPRFVRRVYDIVYEAQRRAIREIRPGAAVAQADRAARNYLAKHKLAKYFGHALGHGVGLEIHESPRLSKDSPSKFREGMIVTVEPAVYIPRAFGIRIEDMVLVTRNGCEVLSDDID